jgi:hypothetical protein
MKPLPSIIDPAFDAELRRVIDERDAFCPRCRYDLSGIPGPRCPECGKNIREILRIADTTPWRLPHVRRRLLAMWVLRRFGIPTMVVAVLAALAWATMSTLLG